MSNMEEIANMLGVELGEEFRVYGRPSSLYRILESRMETVSVLTGAWCEVTGCTLYELLVGRKTLVKIPLKPKMGDIYWKVLYNECVSGKWVGNVTNLADYAIGNVFNSLEKAEANKDKLIARLQKIYDGDKPLMTV